MQCKAKANDIINHAISNNLKQLETSALLIRQNDSYTANTQAVNAFCTKISADITEAFKKIPEEKIHIPLGAVTDLHFLVNMGPEIPFTLVPMGAAKVDYETSFSSTGINLINYKIWIQISAEMKIVNPLLKETVYMERKIMLADLLFSGKVPDHYFHFSQPDEYLLTE